MPQYLPLRIDLGEVGEQARALTLRTANDSQRAEYGLAINRDRAGRLVLVGPVRGWQTGVDLPDVRPGERRVALVHTHSSDSPFSAADLEMLLLPPSHSRAVAASLLATESMKLLLTRTSHTPTLTEDGAASVMFDMEDELILAERDESTPRSNEFPGDPPNALLLGHYEMYVLTRFVELYSLALYSCPITDNVVKESR